MPPSSLLFSPRPWPARTWAALLAALSLATLLIHGFHPFAEDGGLYAAGVEYTLNPTLFPHGTAFVTEHLRFSLFAPTFATAVRVTHLSLASALLAADLCAAFATMLAARELLRRCFPEEPAQLAGLALLVAGWTLPIAGTSLFLMDPYVTARTIALPLSLLALAYALDRPGPRAAKPRFVRHSSSRCAACLLLAAAFHPLMAAYALLFVLAIRATGAERARSKRIAWALLAIALLLFCFVLQAFAPAESAPERAAVITRYYWFLSQWHWYERLGLLGPVIMLALLRRTCRSPQSQSVRTLANAAILLALLCTLCALLFAHEASANHAVARLQLMRVFLLVYAIMLLLLGATVCNACTRWAQRVRGVSRACVQALPWSATLAMAAGLFFAERATYPASPHIELPTRAALPSNDWVQAFLWVSANTPRDALFALDARYVNTAGEDAQTFRAISLRSALPDYSKDGGEASITPALAPAWLAGAEAQRNLSDLDDTTRDWRLAPFGVTWLVLHAAATTSHLCPYSNATVKVCRLQP